jgi:hypothetical protein
VVGIATQKQLTPKYASKAQPKYACGLLGSKRLAYNDLGLFTNNI